MDAPTAAARLPPIFEDWFASRGWSARSHQLEMVAAADAGAHALLIAPTGGGKTLAGFLPSLIKLSQRSAPAGPPRGVHTLYISPLKALAVDIARNLDAPIREMRLDVSVESRTGDTNTAKKQRQRLSPPDILLTTPEQLALFCAWEGAREYFKDLACVILDEIHVLHASKRGDLLNLGLARLQNFAPGLRRVGLSATVDDPERLRDWMSPGAAGAVTLVQGAAGARPIVDVMIPGGHAPWSGHHAEHAMEDVYKTIAQNRTSLVFVNTRWQAEFAFQKLWEINDAGMPIALHHGSLAAEQRRKVEAAMARGELRAIVCTSTLDLGIDWGDVDLVIQLSAPKGSSRMVQRIGRANHRLDEPSRALFVPANRFEVLECFAAREAVEHNELDGDPPHTGTLDTLAQHVMGVACSESFDAVALYEEVTGGGAYRDLSWEDWETVVDFVSTGGYALKNYDKFRRIVQGRDKRWKVRTAEVARRHRMNVGAIVAAGTLNIRVAQAKGSGPGRKVGEAEEWYFEQLVAGDTFLFGGEVWTYQGIRGMDALVTPSKGKEPKIPSWGGSKFPLSTFLANRVRRLIEDEAGWAKLPDDVREWLEIQRHRSLIPRSQDMLLETFNRGRRHYMVGYAFEGRLAHNTLAMLLTRRLERAGAGPLGFVCNDYAFSIWAMRPMGGLDLDSLFAEDMLGDDLEAWLDESYMMKRTFKGCAQISGLIERRLPGGEKSGRQVTVSTDLIYDVLRRHQPDHLMLRCARADASAGLLDVARLAQMLQRIRGRIVHKPLPRVSPFAVPVMLEIGRERVKGAAEDMVLAENEADLVAEALWLDGALDTLSEGMLA